MAVTVSFNLYDSEGNFISGATPTVTVHRTLSGTALPLPVVTEPIPGFYEFQLHPLEDGPSGYLITAGPQSAVPYLHGCIGEMICFPVYDENGEPDASANPVFLFWEDGTVTPLPLPTIRNLGGGLYGFWGPASPGQIIRYMVGANNDWYSGTVGSSGIANTVPTAGSSIPEVQSVTFDVYDSETELGRVLIAVTYPTFDGSTELIWDGSQVCGPFNVSSVPITNGLRYTVSRVMGWPAAPTIRVFLTNYGGREL